ncbi:hypothetical protein [Actinacidiphila glaucinigra]|uniref:Uncharacterized protein n=1 Tax=Actinacidiphila glaucinigra TaxID=235986 RepID=A0A239F541_9ACTN|nr:hypothetical protein [Actinacidiphila glaucinigra]SNS51224.1 hypothetical protein SAMN05216252_106286 [Actinacidiphila glaucinigra]
MADGVVGQLGYDTKTDNVGEIMAFQNGRYHLRPVGGGKEWEVSPDDLAEPDAQARLRARVAELNRSAL